MSAPRRKLDSEDRRQAIIAAVAPLVAEHGLESVTTKAMAAAAGVSEALLYKHFPSKDEIHAAIQGSCIEHATSDARQLEALPDSTECLVLIVWLLVRNIVAGHAREERLIGGKRPLTRMVMRSLLEDGEFAQVFLRGAADGWVGKVLACADAAHRAGDLIDEPKQAALGVWFSHHLAVALVMLSLPEDREIVDYRAADPEGARPSQDELIERVVRFSLRGLGLRPEALARHYRPETFEFLLRGGRESSPSAD